MDEDEACAKCANTKSLMPNLQIRFSTCCGYAICETCLFQLFQFSKQSKCPGCPKRIEKKAFSETNFDGQNYSREATVRKQIERTLCMTEDDFPKNTTGYNDHLEFVTDIVYDMTYGTDEEKIAAEARAKQFYERNKAKIDANWVKKNPLNNSNNNNTNNNNIHNSNSSFHDEHKVPLRMEIPVFLPQVEGPVNILQSDAEVLQASKRQFDAEREEHQKAASISKEAEMQYFENRRLQKIKLRRVGGFKLAYQAQRQQEEAFTDLFYFFRGEVHPDGSFNDPGLPVNIESD